MKIYGLTPYCLEKSLVFNVKTFNNIAQIGLDQFGTDYSVSPEADNADALLLRSHKLQPDEITANVKAIGRAGASVDEWDIDRLNFAIAKFFYMHSLEFNEREADKIVANMYYFEDYQISDMKLSEEQLD